MFCCGSKSRNKASVSDRMELETLLQTTLFTHNEILDLKKQFDKNILDFFRFTFSHVHCAICCYCCEDSCR